MKKSLLALTLFICCNSKAQTVGFKGGVNFCTHKGPDAIEGASHLTAGNAGIFVNHKVGKNGSFEFELGASWEGVNFNFSDGAGSYKGSFKYTYLNFPILYRQRLGKGFFVETGPQIGLLLSGTLNENVYSPFNGVYSTSTDISNSTSKSDFGWDFGIGYHFSHIISAGARYDLGITKLGAPGQPQSNYKNSVFSLNLFIAPFKNNYSNKYTKAGKQY